MRWPARRSRRRPPAVVDAREPVGVLHGSVAPVLREYRQLLRLDRALGMYREDRLVAAVLPGRQVAGHVQHAEPVPARHVAGRLHVASEGGSVLWVIEILGG